MMYKEKLEKKVVVFDKIYVGSGPIMMLDALNSVRNNHKVLIIDKANQLGGAWRSIKLFGENEVENAVHYLLPNVKGYNFIQKNFHIKYENCERKFFAISFLGFKFLINVNNFLGKIIYFINGGDQAHLRSPKFIFKLFFNKTVINRTKYPKEGMLHVVNRIKKSIMKSKVKTNLNENIEKIKVGKFSVTLETNKQKYKTKNLVLSHGFVPCKILMQDGKELKIKKKLNHRPSVHIITKGNLNSKINKKFFDYSQVLFPKSSIIKYVHQLSQFQEDFKSKNQHIVVAALKHNFKNNKKNYIKIAKELETYNCIPKSKTRHTDDFHWQPILIPQIDTNDLSKISSYSNDLISFLETECLNTGIGKYSDNWEFSKNFFYE